MTQEELRSLLKSRILNIVITMHFKPDGDAIGSTLGLMHYLKQLHHNVHVVAPSDFAANLHWMPGAGTIIEYPKQKIFSKAVFDDAELVFCLDFSHTSRVEGMKDLLENCKAKKVIIDHHLNPQNFDDFRVWDVKASSTCELVFDFIVDIQNDAEKLNTDMATCLYSGIYTDSVGFTIQAVDHRLHEKVAVLIKAGAKPSNIHDNLFNNQKESQKKLLGYCLSNRMEVLPEYKAAIISLSKEDLKKFNVQTGDTEGVVNHPLSIQGVDLSAFIVDRNDKIKFSLRSLGDVPANEICSQYLNGGGHKNAAGGEQPSSMGLENAVNYFKEILKNFKTYLV